jgi:hypothetical protein
MATTRSDSPLLDDLLGSWDVEFDAIGGIPLGAQAAVLANAPLDDISNSPCKAIRHDFLKPAPLSPQKAPPKAPPKAPTGPPRRLALPDEPMTNARVLELYDTFDPHSTNHKTLPLAEAAAVEARFVDAVKRLMTANGIPHCGDVPGTISRNALAKKDPRLAHILRGTARKVFRRIKNRLYQQRSRERKAESNGTQP